MIAFEVPDDLRRLGATYAAAGHQFWLVGGCVRDAVLGLPCKDIDVATSATPEEQVEICEAAGHRWFGTGLTHGTLTVLGDDAPYEITSFRMDVETDGRHATVAYTRELMTDLARRDLTMNAVAMSLDGEIVDPFGGVADAAAGRVRFVGDPRARIQEDYLRILRWLRFTGRFADRIETGGPDADAVAAEASGLSRISVERVWSEMRRILSGPRSAEVVTMMGELGILQALGLPDGDAERLSALAAHTRDPALLLAAWLGDDASGVAERWKASIDERDAIAFAAARLPSSYGIREARLDLVEGRSISWTAPLLRMKGATADEVDAVERWTVPTFPVKGRDLLAAGMRPSPLVGETMRAMRTAWIASDYTLGAAELMAGRARG